MFAVLLARPALAPSMVAQAGASKEAPGRDNRYANPVWVTTSEPGVSGGGVNLIITERCVCVLSLNFPLHQPPPEVSMKITVEQPSARELVDRSRVLVHVMLEHPDDIGPNYALLLILADQLQLLRDAFEEDEVRRLRDEKLPV